MPYYKSTKPVAENPIELFLNQTWRPQLTIIGLEGLPPPSVAGNVLKPFLNVKFSLRTPPTLDILKAAKDLTKLLESHPPYDCEVKIEEISPGGGWMAPPMSKDLKEVLNQASLAFYEKEYESLGVGGSIPFMKMLSDLVINYFYF